MNDEIENNEDVGGTHTREIKRIIRRVSGEVLPQLVREVVAEAWKQQDVKCAGHAKILEEFTRSNNELGIKVAVLLDRKESVIKNEDELFKGKNQNAENIVKLGKDVEFLARDQIKMDTRVRDVEKVVDEIGIATGNNSKEITAINNQHIKEENDRVSTTYNNKALFWSAIIALSAALAPYIFDMVKWLHANI